MVRLLRDRKCEINNKFILETKFPKMFVKLIAIDSCLLNTIKDCVKRNTIKTFLNQLFQFILLFYSLNLNNIYNIYDTYGTYTDIS